MRSMLRGVEQRQLEWLITIRSRVRVPAPQPRTPCHHVVITTGSNAFQRAPTEPHNESAITPVDMH
jgi:hypothetical protein